MQREETHKIRSALILFLNNYKLFPSYADNMRKIFVASAISLSLPINRERKALFRQILSGDPRDEGSARVA